MSGRERGSPRARLRASRGMGDASLPRISRRSSPAPEKGTGCHASLWLSLSDSLRRRGQHDTAKMMAQARRLGELCSGRIEEEPVARVSGLGNFEEQRERESNGRAERCSEETESDGVRERATSKSQWRLRGHGFP